MANWLRKNEIAKELGKTPRQIDEMFKRGEVEDNGKSGMKRRFKYKETSTLDNASSYDLKEKHLEVKIKKEQQLLYDNRALLIDKAKDIFVNVYHNPRIQEFSEIVRKYGQGNKELINAWNYQITAGLDKKSKELQLGLAELITS